MKPMKPFLAALAAAVAIPAFAHDPGHDHGSAHDGVYVTDAYARVSTPAARSGAAFLVVGNNGAQDDRLIAAASDIAERVEFHTHSEDAEGVMRMLPVEGGFAIPAGGAHVLERGGDHVMFLGLRQGLSHGDMVTVTFTFEQAGEMTVDIPVDLERAPGSGGHSHGHDDGRDDGHGDGDC